MLPSFIKSFLWGSELEEERYSPANRDEEQFTTEQRDDDWLLISEQGMLSNV